jgi:Tfp pilus assembly protein PilZ
MSEAAQLAKSAREHLAAALNALQSNANVPDGLMAVAEPIAEAMSVLHRVERTDGGDLQGRDSALQNVRGALNQLQAITEHHPAVEVVMEAVALSLAKVHALTRVVPSQAAAPQPAAQPVASAPRPRTTDPVAQPAPQPVAAQPVPAQAAYAAPAAQPAYAAPAAQPAYAPPAAAPVASALPAGGLGHTQALPAQARPMVQPDPFAAPQAAFPAPQAAPQAWSGQPAAPQPAYQQNAAAPAATAVLPQGYAAPVHAAAPVPSRAPGHAPVQHTVGAPPPTQGAPRMDVELGANSSSNFYKGLAGNDVIEHGGIFVATYKIPKIGAPVVLRVLLPGDYEFQANAVVQWTRESSTSDAAEPGFGARFTQIAPDARQLVYRYTRNREPLFYDDL